MNSVIKKGTLEWSIRRAKVKKSIVVSITSLSLISIVVAPAITLAKDKSIKDHIIYIDRPSSFNWVDNHETSLRNAISPTVVGLVEKRDKTLDALEELKDKVLTFSPSGFLEIRSGSKTYNLRNSEDAREMFEIISRYQEFTSKTSGLLNENTVDLDGKSFTSYNYGVTKSLQKYDSGSYNDVVSNSKGQTYVATLKDDIKWASGNTIIPEDFIMKMDYYYGADNYFDVTKDQALNRLFDLENEFLLEIEKLGNSFLDSIVDIESKVTNALNEIEEANKEYEKIPTNQQTNEELRKLILTSNKFLLITDRIRDPIHDIVKKGILLERIISRSSAYLSNFKDESIKKKYVEKLQEIIEVIRDMTKEISTRLSGVNSQLSFSLRIRNNFWKLKWSPSLFFNQISRLNNETKEIINEVVSKGKGSNSVTKLETLVKEAIEIKQSALLNEANSLKSRVFNKASKTNHSSILNNIKLPPLLVPVQKGIGANEVKYFKEDWNAITGSSLTSFCVDNKGTIPFLEKNFLTKEGELYSFNSKEELCSEFTLIFKKDNTVVFRFVENIEDKDFLEIISSTPFLPIDSKKVDINNGIFRGVQNHMKGGKTDSNSAFKIEEIDNDGIRYTKNDNYWNKDEVFLDSYIAKYRGLNDIQVNKTNKAENAFLSEVEVKRLQEENFSFSQINNRSERLVANIFSPIASNNYFNTPIGDSIDWGNDFFIKPVHNYVYLEDGTCEIDDYGKKFPDKTQDNYFCGVIPEYRNFYSAFRGMVSITLETHKLSNYTKRNWYRPAETITPTGIDSDSEDVDFINYVQEAVNHQNSHTLDLDSSNYDDALKYKNVNVIVRKNRLLSTTENLMKPLSLNNTDFRYDIETQYHDNNKIIKWTKKDRREVPLVSETPSFNVELAKEKWANIKRSTPKTWTNNLELKIVLDTEDYKQYALFFQNDWGSNISIATDGSVSLRVLNKNEISKNQSEYVLDKSMSTELDAKNSLLTLNKTLRNRSLSLESMQPHILTYFIENVKRRISENSSISINAKNNLIIDAEKINEAIVKISLDKERVNLLDYISSQDFRNLNKRIYLMFLSEIEAFYIREGYVIPIQNSLEGLERSGVSATRIKGNYLKMNNSYSCLDTPPIQNRIASSGTISIQLPSCQELVLIRELKEKLGIDE